MHNLHYFKYGNQQHSFIRASSFTHFHKTTLCTYIYFFIQIQSISLHKIVLIQHNYRSQVNPKLLQRPACLYLENSFKNRKIMSYTSSVSVCFIKGFLFLKISQNYKTLFYKIFSRSLAFLLKVSKTLCTCLLLKVYKTFNTYLLVFKSL